MLFFMSQNRTSFSFLGVFSTASTPQVEFVHKGSQIDCGLNDIIPSKDSNWSPNTKPPTKLVEINPSMALLGLSTSSIGVLLPVCLLAVFLSCVVCVYHWHSVRERRLDIEYERKRRNRISSDFDPGCTLRTFKPVHKARKVRMYPWKSTRIQDLPDINNDDGFEIPISLEANSKAGCFHGHSLRRLAMGHISVPFERPELKRDSVYHNTSASTSKLSETDFSLKLSSSRSADALTNSCVVASIKKLEKTGLADECYVTGIREEAIHLTHFDVDGQVVVETVNGSLLEYWV